MRFVPDGPDIPNDLIKEWRDGDVLFLAGAGVSVPSNLPLFEGLVLGVYDILGDELYSVLKSVRKRRSRAAQQKILDGTRLAPESLVEASLFLDKQFDRLFSALEKLYDTDARGKLKTRRVRNAVEKILGTATHNKTHEDLLRLSFARSTRGDRSSICRIVTTNFDLLFESAWTHEFKGHPLAFDARMAPRPGAHNFCGVIHLHGALDGTDMQQSNYVLSSRDFARVYLRSGVIGNYIYDLMRRYRLVLVGYSADDPPMRYLMDAIGEDATLFPDMKTPYAITDLRKGADEELEKAVWSAKEISAQFFPRRSGKDQFGPLWESVSKWAEWARDETLWVERELLALMSVRHRDASPFQQAFVQDLLSVLTVDELEEVIKGLAAKKIDFAWVETVGAAIEAATASVKVN